MGATCLYGNHRQNSSTLCHERHVGDEDERDTEEEGREEERKGPRGKDSGVTRIMCVSQEKISVPPMALMFLGSSFFKKLFNFTK